MRYLKSIKAVKPNNYEFYLSFPIILIGIYHSANRPGDFNDCIIMATAMLLGLICAYNAVLDHCRMNIIEYGLALVWFSVLLFFAPFVMWQAFTMKFGGY